MQINEIFFSLQGEGTRRGRPSWFVRLSGCPLRCRWCDTAYAFHEGHEMGVGQILGKISTTDCRMVCVTGGEPLAQPEVHDLMSELLDAGYEVVLETSGAVDARRVDERVIRILDMKAPGSGEMARNHEPTLGELRPRDELKFVLADRADYEWARRQLVDRGLVDRVHCVLFSPVHGELDPPRLAAWILEDALPVTLQFQEHKLLWPEAERGV